jgi:hypothetical protein
VLRHEQLDGHGTLGEEVLRFVDDPRASPRDLSLQTVAAIDDCADGIPRHGSILPPLFQIVRAQIASFLAFAVGAGDHVGAEEKGRAIAGVAG